MRKKLGITLSILILGFLLFLGYLSISYQRFLNSPLIPANQSFDYVLPPGSNITVIANQLQQAGFLHHRSYLIFLASCKHVYKNLKAGEYIFAGGSTPLQIIDQIAQGKVTFRKFYLIEGWNFSRVLAALNKNPYVTHTLTNLALTDVMTKLGYPLNDPEGLFLPATYRFTRGATDISLLQNARQLMSGLLAKEWKNRAPQLPYQTPYQALIVASLVEKETAQTNERPLVAGVIIKRLQINMPLQIDSTIIYGLGKACTGRLTRENLRCDTLYNTYTRKGLPPTPIAMPSRASLHAALHPVVTDALYYVSKNNGTHEFSATLSGQNNAVKKFQLKIVFPVVGRRLNYKTCVNYWYLSPRLESLFSNHC